MCLKPETNKTVMQAVAGGGGASESNNGYLNLLHKANGIGTGTRDKKTKMVESTHSLHRRETKYDILLFLLPALYFKVTPIFPVYIISISRMLCTHILLLSLHYLLFCDKDNYDNKLTQKQPTREKEDYLIGTVLHMYAQIALQILFPGMFFTDNSISTIKSCAINAFASHVLAVEPLYYFAHCWLHIPEHMKHSTIHIPHAKLSSTFHIHCHLRTSIPPTLLPRRISALDGHWSTPCTIRYRQRLWTYEHLHPSLVDIQPPILAHQILPFLHTRVPPRSSCIL